MKKFFFVLLILSCLVFAGAVLVKDGMDKKILTLKNGTMIEVDYTWESGDIFFYEIDGEAYLLNKEEVKSVGIADYRYYTNQFKSKAAHIGTKTITKIKAAANLSSHSIEKNSTLVVFVIGGTLLCIFILLLTRALVGLIKGQNPPENAPALDEGKDDDITRLDVVRYFLNIFKLQIGAPPDAPMKVAPLSSQSSEPNFVYELWVMDRGEWVKRRMTIGPLGEETGSKSKCFYVIYDAHLVIKIHRRPITDFDQYIASIHKEGQIVEKLAPKVCVIPKVSVILNLIHKLPDSEHLTPERLEERYVSWLRKNTDYQDYLKIKNTFIFFMDFSKFYFLSHIIDNLHDFKDSIPTEIAENPETILEVSKFKGRYGLKNESVFYEIRQVYNQFEAETLKFLTESGEASSIPIYRRQSWFLTHLAGGEISAKDSGLPEKLVPALNRLIRNILAANKETIVWYRKTIKEYVYRIRLEQNKPQMAGIIINLIDLLTWLRERQVSLRDLKPDNLLVAGNPSKYPLFLMSADEYSLGIIDVETAVDFEKSRYKKTKQPLLGGTPFYATPSHFFTNETLGLCFHNFRKILHYQDWHAMTVMIFKVITGDLLFEQTAKLFSYIKDRIRSVYADAEGQIEVLKEVSRMFWRSATIEFQVKMGEKEEALKSIHAIFPDNVKRMFMKLGVKDQKFTTDKINHLIASQVAFKSHKSRDLLFRSSPAKILQFKKHLERKFKTSPSPTFDTDHLFKFIDDLAQLKLYCDQQKQMVTMLNQSEPKISAYDLLYFMFYTVYHSMFREDWQMVCEKDVCFSETLDDEATTLEAGL